MEQELGIGSRIKHPELGLGVIVQISLETYTVIFIHYGEKKIARNLEDLEIIEAVPPKDDQVSKEDIEKSLINILRRFSDLQETADLGDKWEGGKLILQPADSSKASKEMPLETFFHKIVMVRDRLRLMEQRVNTSESLTEAEKVNFQQYLTRIYGSLTSFNVLFKNRDDGFVGSTLK